MKKSKKIFRCVCEIMKHYFPRFTKQDEKNTKELEKLWQGLRKKK